MSNITDLNLVNSTQITSFVPEGQFKIDTIPINRQARHKATDIASTSIHTFTKHTPDSYTRLHTPTIKTNTPTHNTL